MNGEWELTTIGDLITKNGGSIKTGPFGTALKASEYSKNGVPLISVGEVGYGTFRIHDSTPRVPIEVVKRLPMYVLQSGDIVFGRKGAVDRSAMVKPEQAGWFLGSDGIRLRLPNTCHAGFIAFQLQSQTIRNWILHHATGTTMASLNQGTIERIPIILPSLSEQKYIAHVLGTLDDKIALNRQINQTLEAMAQALFKSWFVDFEPVRAKVAALELGENPTRAAMRAISGKTDDELDTFQTTDAAAYAQLQKTASLFPDEFEESELGLVPKGWEVSEIGNEVEVVGGGTPSTSNSEFWEDGTINWTSPKDLSGLTDKILLSTASKITPAGLKKISSGLLPVNTVLMSSRAPVGYLALAKIPVAINQGYIALKCNKNLSPEYIIQWMQSVMDEIKQRASGSTFAEISKASFRPIKALVPSYQLIEVYTNQARVIYNLITEKAKDSNQLAILRDTLLPKLLSEDLIV